MLQEGNIMSYRVKYSARQGSWFIEVDGSSDDFGTSLYDTEQEAYDELAQMVAEGLITLEEIDTSRATWVD
jgi:hypothetical protein